MAVVFTFVGAGICVTLMVYGIKQLSKNVSIKGED